MKRLYIFIYLFLLFSLSVLVRCDHTKNLNDVRVVGVLVSEDYRVRWEQERIYFQHKAEQNNLYILSYYVNSANLEYHAQELLVNEMQVLVIISDDRLDYCPIIQECHKRNIQVISYDRLVRNCEIDFHVGFDVEEIGRTQAKHLVDKYRGNYIIINGALSDRNSFFLKTGQFEILNPYLKRGAINLVGDFNASSVEEAYLAMAKFIRENPETEIDVVMASSDLLAEGVIKALEHYGVKAVVSGKGASIDGCKRILEGKQEMSIYLPSDMLAQAAAEISVMLINKKEIKPDALVNNNTNFVPTIMIPSMVVNKNTIKISVIGGLSPN